MPMQLGINEAILLVFPFLKLLTHGILKTGLEPVTPVTEVARAHI
jgi:hypothetical protein